MDDDSCEQIQVLVFLFSKLPSGTNSRGFLEVKETFFFFPDVHPTKLLGMSMLYIKSFRICLLHNCKFVYTR